MPLRPTIPCKVICQMRVGDEIIEHTVYVEAADIYDAFWEASWAATKERMKNYGGQKPWRANATPAARQILEKWDRENETKLGVHPALTQEGIEMQRAFAAEARAKDPRRTEESEEVRMARTGTPWGMCDVMGEPIYEEYD